MPPQGRHDVINVKFPSFVGRGGFLKTDASPPLGIVKSQTELRSQHYSSYTRQTHKREDSAGNIYVKVCQESVFSQQEMTLFDLSQTSKQIINSIISHFGHGSNHSFDNQTPLHFGAFSLRNPMKCIIKYSGAHRGNSEQQIPGAKIIIYFPSTESTRLTTVHLIVSLSSGLDIDAS